MCLPPQLRTHQLRLQEEQTEDETAEIEPRMLLFMAAVQAIEEEMMERLRSIRASASTTESLIADFRQHVRTLLRGPR